MQNKLPSIGAELEKDQCKGVEIRDLNGTEKFTARVLSVQFVLWSQTPILKYAPPLH